MPNRRASYVALAASAFFFCGGKLAEAQLFGSFEGCMQEKERLWAQAKSAGDRAWEIVRAEPVQAGTSESKALYDESSQLSEAAFDLQCTQDTSVEADYPALAVSESLEKFIALGLTRSNRTVKRIIKNNVEILQQHRRDMLSTLSSNAELIASVGLPEPTLPTPAPPPPPKRQEVAAPHSRSIAPERSTGTATDAPVGKQLVYVRGGTWQDVWDSDSRETKELFRLECSKVGGTVHRWPNSPTSSCFR